jgi:hypothetical protein
VKTFSQKIARLNSSLQNGLLELIRSFFRPFNSDGKKSEIKKSPDGFGRSGQIETLNQKIARLTASLQNGLLEVNNLFVELSDFYEVVQEDSKVEIPGLKIRELELEINNLENIFSDLDKNYKLWLESDLSNLSSNMHPNFMTL